MSQFVESEINLGALFFQIQSDWRRVLDSPSADLDLTKTQWLIVRKLFCCGPQMTQMRLKDVCVLDDGQLTRALNVLEEKGYICRALNRENRRTRDITLLEPEAEYLQEIIRLNQLIQKKVLAHLSQKQKNALIDELEAIRANVRQLALEVEAEVA